MPSPVRVVFTYWKAARYAVNVLAGALDAAAPQAALVFARDRDAFARAVREGAAAGEAVVGAWSFYSAGFREAAAELAAVRAALGGLAVPQVAGGVHASAEPEATLRAGFDFAAVGEGERTLVELCRRAAAGEPFAGLRGLAWLEGGALRTAGRGEAGELDPWPPFSPRHARIGPIEITRGCVYACRFCQTPFQNRARFRHRSVGEVARWARVFPERGLRDLRFLTPTALSYGAQGEAPELAAVEALLAAVREAAGPGCRIFFGTFPSEVRPEHVTPEAMRILRRWVDNDNLVIGGQSASERVLRAAKRGHGAEVIESAARIAREAGFTPNVDFIFGLPGEEPEDAAASLAMMRRLAALGARVHGHAFMPLPGTPWKDEAPGAIDEATRAGLAAMVGAGSAYGQWERQAAVARELVAARRRR